MIGMSVTHDHLVEQYSGVVTFISGIVDAVSVMADGLAIARVNDRWVPVDELVAV